MRRWLLFSALLLALPVSSAWSQQWAGIGTVSTTMGAKSGRLCVGEGDATDTGMGCPAYAPSLTTAGHVSVTGSLSAQQFIGDGSMLTGMAGGDRITSGTLAIVTNSATSVVSLSIAGTTWGYLSNAMSYLPRINTERISSSLISSTYIQLSSATDVLSCNAARTGTLRHVSGSIQFCDDNTWKSLTGVGQFMIAFGGLQSDVTAGAAAAYSTSSGNTSLVTYNSGTRRFTLKGGSTYRLLSKFMIDGTTSPTGGVNVSWYNVTTSTLFGAAGNVMSGNLNTPWSDTEQAIAYISPASDTVVELRITNVNGVGIDITNQYAFIDVMTTTAMSGGGGASALSDLTDVSIAGATTGSILAYNGSSWVVSSTVSASAALGDRITSGTLAMIANSNTSVVSLSTAGTTWGYFGNTLSFLPALSASHVQVSGSLTLPSASVSATIGAGSDRIVAASTTVYAHSTLSLIVSSTNSQLHLTAAASGAIASIEVGTGRTANGYSYIDLVGDTTYSDFGLRIVRENTGPNAASNISHRGTGEFRMSTVEAAGIVLATQNQPRLAIGSTGVIQFNSYGAGTLTTNGSGVITASSDERLKDIHGSYTRGLEAIGALHPITYHWTKTSGYDDGRAYSGFSAQDVQRAIPEAVSAGENGFLTLADRPILAASVNAIKELKAVNDNHVSRTEALEARLRAADERDQLLRSEVDALRRELRGLKRANDKHQ